MQITLANKSDYIALLLGDPSRIKLWMSETPERALAGLKRSRPHDQKTVLLLGGNGFIGIHLLHDLLQREEVSRVIALVRPSRNASAEKRIDDRVRQYRMFLPNREKLEAMEGAFSSPQMGLSAIAYERLVNEVDIVVNAAGSTNHTYPYTYFRKETIFPMLDLLDFCTSRRLKSLHMIGSVGCEAYNDRRDFFRLGFFYCGYSRMKWVTKHIMARLHGMGLPTHMYLPSFVLGSRHTAYRDPGMQYSFWLMIWYAHQLGMMWDCKDHLIPVVPGDVLARAVVDNALARKPEAIVYPAQFVSSMDLARSFGLRHVSWDEFKENLEQRFSPWPSRMKKSGFWSSLLDAVRHAFITRQLFPNYLPRIIRNISNVSTSGVKQLTSDVPPLDVVMQCAQNNYMLNRQMRGPSL